MKAFKKSVFSLLAVLIVLFVPFSAFANDYSFKPYYFSSYDVEINVTEDNILQVTENIDANFNQPRHGIYRNIPVKNSVQRADGTTGTTRAKISHVRCSDNYSSSFENSSYVMQIGDEDVTLTGPHHYEISYDYKFGKDIADGADEFYYNIIGDGWDTYIQNVTFKITMPKEFEPALLGFSSGAYGTEGTDKIEYYVNGNEISGRLTSDLAPYEAFTVRLELPDGYFYFNESAHMARLALMIAIPVLCLLFVLLIWSKFGKDKKVDEIVEFYPPEGMSSADVAFWYKGAFTNQDAVPLLIELANEGYIKIGSGRRRNDYVIERVKTYDGSDENKHIFFSGLFENGRKTVTGDDLEEKFYTYLNRITVNYSSFENRHRVYSSSSLALRVLCWAASIICFALNIFIFIGTFGTVDKVIAFAVGELICFIAFITAFFVRKRTDEGHMNLQKIKGFKMFLETAEKERLETLVDENPEYFYDIMPYAYVLGVSDKWMKKFENIAINPPSWYYGYNTFTFHTMYHFMNSTVRNCSEAMTSVPQTSSSGGFSGGGGGFSGGGSGGGGGGSW